MTIFFRLLAKIDSHTNVNEAITILNDAFYQPGELKDKILDQWMEWLTYYLARLRRENQPNTVRVEKMNRTNPKYVLRNYMAQMAIDKSDQGDYSLVSELYDLLANPYGEQPEQEKWFSRRPEWARHKIGCAMLSCSS